ncbi:hypothetical protein BDA96_10G339700 [Sorghum bicolor]|uniref:Uncharacterized protein n=2 Tax=Sorghum bicolor TaxID=4558 RepID=A0A921U336_SORBI|nr:uncharacterized protein LOC8064985 [Sorghum bicolor]KAG0516176.1 hypothetical protein BDA96_10G339700 [Sorghum bicolor]|eukprot:XP_002437587.1 uncharacterized protein LOC8064985 [Sorghum bicolor]
MGLSRRFLNLIVGGHAPTVRSLRCIDLKRLQLFYPTPPSPTNPAASTMETFGLPGPTPIFRACDSGADCQWRVACYPLSQRRVLCTDQCRRNLLYDASTHEVAAIPEFYRPRLDSLSLFVPASGEEGEDEKDRQEGSEDDDDQQRGGGGGSLFLMEKILRPVTGDLEVLFYGNGRRTSHCKLLPPPPYIHEPSKIGSYAVVGNGAHVCISVNGRGTYFLDTAGHTWNKAGDWTLPFHGKVEYVPELKLWFGLSANAQHLIAADLSTTDSQPQPVNSWKLFQPLEEWIEHKDAQLVNLGSGRFCVARFFIHDFDFVEQDDSPRDCIVLTGLEVIPRVLNGKVKLEMIPHKSMRHTTLPVYGNSVDLVF